MEATVVSLGKAVLDGALGYAKSAAAEEMALQLGLERDVGFVADEMEMMQSFLMTAADGGHQHQRDDKVLTTWVKQVRDVAYNVEDNLVDFAIQAERGKTSCLGCIPRNLCDRSRIAKEVKELKAKVEDVSSRNRRYRLIKDGAAGASEPAASLTAEQGGIAAAAAAAMFGVDHEKAKVDLLQLVMSEELNLRVIAVWGTSGDLGKMSEICKVVDDPNVRAKFGCHAWVRVTTTRPFDPKEFLRSMVRQFCETSYQAEHEEDGRVGQHGGGTVGGDVLLRMEKMGQSDLVRDFSARVSSDSYLVVIDGLSTMDEWRCIKTYFPDKKSGSRIVVATQQVEVASLCTEQPYQVSELKQLSAEQILYLFHKKVQKPEMEIKEEGGQQPNGTRNGIVVPTRSIVEKQHDRSKSRAVIPEDVVGRKTEKQKLIDLVGRPDNSDVSKVISVWGMGGIGKTTLVRSAYRSQELGGWKRGWVTAWRPFNVDSLLRQLALQLEPDIQEDSTGADEQKQKKKNIGAMEFQEMVTELSRPLETKNCLIILDDLSSTQEWDAIKHFLANARRIIITTREKIVAKHCSEDDSNMFSLKGLEADASLDLFKKKVFKDSANFDLHPGMLDQAKLVLKKCDGLPLAISTIGSYLANKPKTAMEWRRLNDGLSAELEINAELKMIKAVLMRSYDGLPYHLKASFLYLSIFPEDYIIRRKHVVKRWTAEGYSRDMHHMTSKQVGGKYFEELVDRSMILPLDIGVPGKIDYCQLHDLIREICVLKAREENLVFTLEEGCNLGGAQGAIRHLTISSNWKRDKDVMQRMLDLSHLRSLTVFGEWSHILVSKEMMRFLRVLDLEHTTGLRQHHLDKIMELLHLRYLSLRGCKDIFYLPKSLANLGQLQTLDVRGTRIWRFPAGVAKLQKLQYLHASGSFRGDHLVDSDKFWAYKGYMDPRTNHSSHRLRVATLMLHTGHLLCRPQLLEAGSKTRSGGPILKDSVSREDLVKLYQCYFFLLGAYLPRGISKLRALHTLCVVNVRHGTEAKFKELRKLTQLRKFGVVGVHNRNMEMFWRSIAGLDRLRSLSVDRDNMRDTDSALDDCLGQNLWPPRCLETLKMRCKLVRLAEWIHRLQDLAKLQLQDARLCEDDLKAIGMLPHLAVLRLKKNAVDAEELHFKGLCFPSLLVLELHTKFDSLRFGKEAMPKLKVLQATTSWHSHTPGEISGLQFLTSLKEIRLDEDGLKEIVQRTLAEYPNDVVLKML